MCEGRGTGGVSLREGWGLRTRALRGALAAIAWLGLTAPAATVAQTPHTVEPGESLWSIAVVNGISADELAAANGLPADAPLVAGEAIQIPPAPSSTGSAGGGSGACTWHCASSLHPHPTDEVVSPEQVGEIAASYGMSPSLVQAMANVESGFDNSAVSTSDARGVMQIIPSTWDYIEEELTGHRLDPRRPPPTSRRA